MKIRKIPKITKHEINDKVNRVRVVVVGTIDRHGARATNKQ